MVQALSKQGFTIQKVSAIAIEMEPVKDYRPKPGVFIQKGEELLASVIACMKKVGEKIGDRKKNIAAISFTGQMSGFMGVDKDWNDITTCPVPWTAVICHMQSGR